MQLSWSQIQTFLTCNRKWELSHIEGLEKPPGTDKRGMILGSAFHEAIAEFLREKFLGTSDDRAIKLSVLAGLNYLSENLEVELTVYDYDTGEYRLDEDYYNMMEDLHNLLPKLVKYHIPQIGIGTKYRVASMGAELTSFSSPAVELEIDTEDWKGFVDAILIDVETGEFVAVDWKMRSTFPFDAITTIDGQLPFYAAILNDMGFKINKTIMWQFRSKVPKPARINKNGMPSIQAQDTTLEHWTETLPAPLQEGENAARIREKVLEVLLPRLKKDIDYQNTVESIVTDFSSKMAMDVADAVRRNIEEAVLRLKADRVLPARLSTYGCQGCEFWRLCSAPLKYGGDASDIIEIEYREKKR